MRIVCPSCSAANEVRDDLLAPGRSVRCTRCSEEWQAIPATAPPTNPADEPGDEPAARTPPPQPSAAASPRLTAMDRLASQPAAVPRASNGLRVAWAASLLVLLLFVGGMLIWRAGVMRAWPPSTRLYDAIGLAPAPPPAR
jgi:predicted Zn finger-like uncharacterized protein